MQTQTFVLNYNEKCGIPKELSALYQTSPTPTLFINQLKMFASLLATDNAFVYLYPEQTLLSFGKHALANKQNDIVHDKEYETANFDALLSFLLDAKTDLSIVSSSQIKGFTPRGEKVCVYLARNHQGKVLAVMGSLVAPQLSLSKQKSELLQLVANQLQVELRLREELQQTQEMQTRLEQISNLNQDYICVKDLKHCLVYANQALKATFPETVQNKLIGNTALEYFEPEIRAQIVDSDLSAIKDGVCVSNSTIVLANGQEQILHNVKKTFTGQDGKVYIMSISRDITEKEILISDLKRSNSDLDNFAYVASHDLKSPLNVIKRLVTWVSEDCADILPQDSKEDLELVLNRATRMEKLLVDLLSYSRIGKDYQEATVVNLKELVIELLSLIDLPMGFVVNCEDIDIKVPVVPFNVVMLNLIANAIKHHDSGNAKIEIGARCSARKQSIFVKDNGPGIEEKNRSKIFQLFETLKPRDEVEGSGMGLSVVKKIVEHYGGSVKVSSNVPRGTKFTVIWPTTNMAKAVLDKLSNTKLTNS